MVQFPYKGIMIRYNFYNLGDPGGPADQPPAGVQKHLRYHRQQQDLHKHLRLEHTKNNSPSFIGPTKYSLFPILPQPHNLCNVGTIFVII